MIEQGLLTGMFTAAAAGLASFVSPCVMPLVPGYLAFISGISVDSLREGVPSEVSPRRVLVPTLAFVLGFSLIFTLLGASAALVGINIMTVEVSILGWEVDIAQLAGVPVILFGFYVMGLIPIPWLSREARFKGPRQVTGVVGAFAVGLAFAFGWTPCIGPFLGGILMVASNQETVGKGVVLLLAYSAGLGIPFVMAALFVNEFLRVFARVRKYFRAIEIVGGLMLIGLGVLILLNKLTIFFSLFDWALRPFGAST